MSKGNIIKFQGKTYNLDDIKAGIQKKDFESAKNDFLFSVFDALDKKDKNGFKNQTLDVDETKEFIQNLIGAAVDKKLSKHEAEQYLASLGIENINSTDLAQFLDIITEKSKDIRETTYDKKRNSTVIEYNEGYYDEILYDGRHAVKAKESKDTSLQQADFEFNVPFTYMADRDGTYVVEPEQEHDFRTDVEDLISRNNIDPSTAQISDTGAIYFDNDGNEALRVQYGDTWRPDLTKFYIDEENKTVIRSIEYKQGDNWIKLDINNGMSLTEVSVLNNDRSITLSKTSYDGNARTAQLTYNTEIGRATEIEYDYITGRQKRIMELDEQQRTVKIKNLDESGEVISTVINEYYGNNRTPVNTKKFDKNNQLIVPEGKKTVISSQEEYRKYMEYGDNYALFMKLENDINDPSARELLKTTLEDIKNTKLQPNGKILSMVGEKEKAEILNLVSEMFEKCEKLTNLDEIRRTIALFEAEPRAVAHMLLNKLYNNTPDGTLDQVSYQGYIGDCWLLSPTNAIAETPDGGQEYISSFFEKDENGNIVDKDGNVTVILNGGKNKYVITPQDRQGNSGLSIGEANTRALEIAFYKYAQEFGINGNNYLDGGYARIALEIYSGNKSVYATRQNDKLGIMLNGEFIELSEENADKLTEIPICIKNITKDDLETLAKIKSKMAMCCSSNYYMEEHAMYVKNINKNSVQVKEPGNTGIIATYSFESFLETCGKDEITLFILPKKNNLD